MSGWDWKIAIPSISFGMDGLGFLSLPKHIAKDVSGCSTFTLLLLEPSAIPCRVA